MKKERMRKIFSYLTLFLTLLLGMVMFGCEGDKGDRGFPGANGTSFGTLTGTVTDTAVPPHNLAGITVSPSPSVSGVASATTDANGKYSLTIPNGNYTINYSKAGYASASQSATVVSTQTTTLPTIALQQTSAAVVNVASAKFVNGSATLSATALVNDPALQGQPATFTWKDANGNVIGTGPSITVQQPGPATFIANAAQAAFVRQSVYPQGTDPLADENDFDLPRFLPLDRLQVLPVSQQSFDQGGQDNVKVFAQIGSNTFNTYSTSTFASIPSNTTPFVPNGGIRNVAIGQPVVIQGNASTTNQWTWTITRPTGSNVTVLADANTQYPHFIPDAPGIYTITENFSGGTKTINIYAGGYVGILNPAPNNDPLGVIDPSCSQTGCHSGTSAFNTPFNNNAQFFSTTPVNSVFNDWNKSGHRMIMVQGMRLGTHYSLNSCAKCHSVGFSQFSSAIKSQGFSDVARASGFTDATFLANSPTFFAGPAGVFPQVLRKSEAQCETCHGPNGDGSAHNNGTADSIGARFSVSSDVCGTCHGEPLRHGRYQEWRVSGHGDFQTAMLEAVTGVTAANPLGTGPNASCVGCHSAQGFQLLVSQLQGTNGNTPNPNRTIANRPAGGPQNLAYLAFLRTDNVQPQTCAACHQVHNPGNESGLTGAIVILRGDYQAGGAFAGFTPLLPSGFQANGVGMGALCITCHNSRNGGVGPYEAATVSVHEDGDQFFALVGAPTGTPLAPTLGYSAPHEACQGDVLMGRNAYFFSGPEDTHNGLRALPAQVGERSRHSFLPDSCVTCHLLKTPTDPNFGYPPGVSGAGTNHTFNIVTNINVPAADQINALCSQCHGGFQGTALQQSFDVTYKQALIATGNAVLRIKFGSAAAVPAGSTLTFIPGRTPEVSFNGGPAQTLASFLTGAPGTAKSGPPTGPPTAPATAPAAGVQLDIAKANWDLSLVAPRYTATQLDGQSYDDGTPIATSPTATSVQVAGDQSKAVHNPSFVNNVLATVIFRMNSL